MICPHCSIHFHENWAEVLLMRNGAGLGGKDLSGNQYYWWFRSATCAGSECGQITMEICKKFLDGLLETKWRQVFPIGANRGPVSPDVPPEIAKDYVEACNVLPISPKASAALSRRCLQRMLRAGGYFAKDLAKEIDLLLNETDPKKALPHKLRETVDAIRNFGNFSAHPIDDKTTLQVIESFACRRDVARGA
jgi:hypothetical protein